MLFRSLTNSAPQHPEFHLPERQVLVAEELATVPLGLLHHPPVPHPAAGSHVLYSQHPSAPSQSLTISEDASQGGRSVVAVHPLWAHRLAAGAKWAGVPVRLLGRWLGALPPEPLQIHPIPNRRWHFGARLRVQATIMNGTNGDRKSTRLNSSHW